MRKSISRTVLGAVAVATLLAPSSGSAAGTPQIIAIPGNTFTPYHPAVMEAGDEILYRNLDTAIHDVQSNAFGPDGTAHCFKRVFEVPDELLEPYDPSTAKFVYHKADEDGDPDYDVQGRPVETLNPDEAALDANGQAIRLRVFPMGKCPLFYTGLIGLSQAWLMEGLQNVQAGTVYDFKCTVHASMLGKLAVAPALP